MFYEHEENDVEELDFSSQNRNYDNDDYFFEEDETHNDPEIFNSLLINPDENTDLGDTKTDSGIISL